MSRAFGVISLKDWVRELGLSNHLVKFSRQVVKAPIIFITSIMPESPFRLLDCSLAQLLLSFLGLFDLWTLAFIDAFSLWQIWSCVSDVHEIYTIKYSHIYIFSLTFMLFCVWLYNIFVLQVTRALHAKWGQTNWIKPT